MDTPELDTPVEPTIDPFEAAFGEATSETPPVTSAAPEATPPAATTETPAPAATTETPAPAAAPEATPPAATTETPAPAPAPAAAPEATPPAAAAPEVTPPAAPAPAVDNEALARAVADALARQPAQQPQQQQPPAQPARQDYRPDEFLSDADKAAVAKFEQEWPDEFKAIQRMNQAYAQALVTNVVNGLVADIDKVLAPILQSTQRSEVNTNRVAILSAHPDYDAIAADAEAWAAAQTTLVGKAVHAALKSGDPVQVVEAVGVYKQAKGMTGAAPAAPAPSAPQAPAPAAAAPKAPVNPAAVAATAVAPAAQRPKPNSGADPLDIEAAFDEAIKELAPAT